MSATKGGQSVPIEPPVLRETFTMDGAAEKWAHPCPSWCLGSEYEGHDPDRIANEHIREHGGAPILIRQDGADGYRDYEGDGRREVEGTRTAHLEARLVQGSRGQHARIRLITRWGKDGQRKSFRLAAMWPDEVRELIDTLEYLLAVAEAEQ